MKKKTTTKAPKLTKEQKKELREKEIYKSLIQNQAKRINDRYRSLEKAGLDQSSQSYKTVEHYAVSDPKGKGKNYNIDYITGRVRVSADTRKMSLKEMKEYSQVLSQILKHKTSTVSGVKKAMEQSYKTAKERYNFEGSQKQYNRIWETYKNNVEQDKRQKLNSDLVIAIMEYTDIYKMSKEDIDAAFNYLNRADDMDEAYYRLSEIQEALEIVQNNSPEEAAKILEEKNFSEIVWTFPTIFNKVYKYMTNL